MDSGWREIGVGWGATLTTEYEDEARREAGMSPEDARRDEEREGTSVVADRRRVPPDGRRRARWNAASTDGVKLGFLGGVGVFVLDAGREGTGGGGDEGARFADGAYCEWRFHGRPG